MKLYNIDQKEGMKVKAIYSNLIATINNNAEKRIFWNQ